jgi:cytochrome c biogenesis protein CcmG/thiol:disulfide interchange protein DsbE
MTRSVRLGVQGVAVAAVVGLLALLIWRVTSDHGRPTSGPAPGFELPRIDASGDLSLASLRGKGVVLNFWASWCIPCKAEAKALEVAWRKYRTKGLVVLGVNEEDFTGDARKFAHEHGMTYPLVHDGPGKMKRAYGLTGYPETFFVNRDGKLVSTSVIGPVNHGDNVKLFAEGISRALQ